MALLRIFALITAFCAMGFQLTLAQCITSLLGGAILQYSIVIGLFIGSLGMGAATVAWKNYSNPFEILLAIECLLSLLTPIVTIILFQLDAHGLTLTGGIILSLLGGVLSGVELPLLVSAAEQSLDNMNTNDRSNEVQKLVGLDFLGTFAAALAGPLVLFPTLNLAGTSAFLGLLSALAAVILLCLIHQQKLLSLKTKLLLFALTACNILIAFVMIVERESIAQWLSDRTFIATNAIDRSDVRE